MSADRRRLTREDVQDNLAQHMGYGDATAASPYWQGWRDCTAALLALIDAGEFPPASQDAANVERRRARLRAVVARTLAKPPPPGRPAVEP